MPVIYLDNNATTQMDDRVLAAMLPYFSQHYANAGSTHLFGLGVKESLEVATEQMAQLIGCRPAELLYTSGATESINLVLKGIANGPRKRIVTIATEHKAVLDTCMYLEVLGLEVTILSVDHDGKIDLTALQTAVNGDTLLVCVMLANNETGVVHPVAEIAEMAHQEGALVLCDATQAVGKITVDVNTLGIDFLAFSAHKFYGPKGSGGLYIASGTRKFLSPEIHGGGQQRSLRSGTLNVPGIIGLGMAAHVALDDMPGDTARITALRDRLEAGLLSIGRSFVNGAVENRLPNTTNICFSGINSEKMIIGLQNIAVSSGSACSAVTSQPSHVLKAMGLTDAEALSSLRFSLGRFNTLSDIDTTIEKASYLIKRLSN